MSLKHLFQITFW